VILSAMWNLDRTFWVLALAIAAVLIAARYTCLMKNAWL
jgi:hypothetical protein